MLADLVGRRVTLLMAVACRSIGLILLGLLEWHCANLSIYSRFLFFFFAAMCEGTAQAFGSGTDVALLHDSVQALDRKKDFQRILSQRSMMWPFAACLANLIGGLLAERISMAWCIYATIGTTLAALPMAWMLIEVYPRVYDPERIIRKMRERPRGISMSENHTGLASVGGCFSSSGRRLDFTTPDATPEVYPRSLVGSVMPITHEHEDEHELELTAAPKYPPAMLINEADVASDTSSDEDEEYDSADDRASKVDTHTGLHQHRPSMTDSESSPTPTTSPLRVRRRRVADEKAIVTPSIVAPASTLLLTPIPHRPSQLIIPSPVDTAFDGPSMSIETPPTSCPSPLSSHPPHSVQNFMALLKTHLLLCLTSMYHSWDMQELVLLSTLIYASSEPPHRLRALFFTAHHIAPSRYGAVAATMFFLSSVGSWCSSKLNLKGGDKENTSDNNAARVKKVLLATCIIPPILLILSTYCDGLLSAFLLLPISFLWGIRVPIMSGLLHRTLRSSSQRATVVRMQSLAHKLALAVCLAGFAGPLTDAYSIDTTVRTFALLSFIPIVWIAKRKELGKVEKKDTVSTQ